MPESQNKVLNIELCMGSSCFSHGSNKVAKVIKEYIAQKELEVKVDFKGCLCLGDCKEGANIIINGKRYSKVTYLTITDILDYYIANLTDRK